MADAKATCKHCGTETDHMHLGGKTGICSICGETNEIPYWNKVKAEVERRMAAAQADLAARHVLTTSDLVEKKETPAPAQLPAARPERLQNNTNKENEMKQKRLTKEQIIEVQEKFAARIAGGEGRMEACAAMAKEYGVSAWSIRDKVGVQAPKKKAPAAAAHEASPAAAPAPHCEAPAGSLREVIERICDDRIAVRLASIGLENLDARVEAAVVRILK